MNNQWLVCISAYFSLVYNINNTWYFQCFRKCPGYDFPGKQIHDTGQIDKFIYCPDIGNIRTSYSIQAISIKLFVKDIFQFSADVRIFCSNRPQFAPLHTNPQLTHVCANGPFRDDLTSFAQLYSNFRCTIVVLGIIVNILYFSFYRFTTFFCISWHVVTPCMISPDWETPNNLNILETGTRRPVFLVASVFSDTSR